MTTTNKETDWLRKVLAIPKGDLSLGALDKLTLASLYHQFELHETEDSENPNARKSIQTIQKWVSGTAAPGDFDTQEEYDDLKGKHLSQEDMNKIKEEHVKLGKHGFYPE